MGQLAAINSEPPIFQLGLPPGVGAYACTDCVCAMIVRHETGHAVTAAQVRAASGNTNSNSGLTPAQALRALSALGVHGYAFHTGVSASDVLKATDAGIVLAGVGYYAYPTLAQAEFGGRNDNYGGPHAIAVFDRRYWPQTKPAPAYPPGTVFQVPFRAGWRCWIRDPDHTQGWGKHYDRMGTWWLTKAMSALVGDGSPAWQTTFMLAKAPLRLGATSETQPGFDTPIDQPRALSGARAVAPAFTGKFGAKPPYPEADKPRLKIGPHLRALPVVEASVDWYSKVEAWPMYLNDQIGDCTAAEVGHQVESSSTYGQGQTVLVADSDVLSMYKAVSGYNGTPATDAGAVIQDVLGYWRKSGIAGRKCLAFAQVDITNQTEVKQAVDLFGSLDLGLVVPASAMTQFDAFQTWDVVANDGGIEGGHSVEMVGYNATGPLAVTWGRVQQMTWAFWTKYITEAWAIILPEWVDANGHNPDGLDLVGLGDDFSALTGEPDPFPAGPPVTPAPVPNPPSPAIGCLTVIVPMLAVLTATIALVR